MSESVKPVDEALPAVRKLLADAGGEYRIVGGLAVIHHGYRRTTEDIDLLIDGATLARLDELAAGFARLGPRKLRHEATEVDVDLLVAGDPMPRATDRAYPAPGDVAGSAGAPDVIALPNLLELKLRAARHQDMADVVQLLKQRSEAEYLALEAALGSDLRPELARLREDALEELRFEQ
jgi:hypothetical protein